jgi:hypothetical protein
VRMLSPRRRARISCLDDRCAGRKLAGSFDRQNRLSALSRRAGGAPACPVLLAPAGREPLDPTPVWVDAPAQLGAARANRLTDDGGLRPSRRREDSTRETCPRNIVIGVFTAGIQVAVASA